jgi:hypothetical protein
MLWSRRLAIWEPEPACRACGGLAGVRLDALDELLEVRRREILAGDEDHRVAGEPRNRIEVLEEIVFKRIDRAVRNVGAEMADTDGVAVGRRGHHAADPDRATGAGDVLDQHRLAERGAHALAEHARQHVGRAAGGERHDDGDRAVRVALRRSRCDHRGHRENHRGNRRQHRRRSSCRGHSKLHLAGRGKLRPATRQPEMAAASQALTVC